jgi:hypothetical protein
MWKDPIVEEVRKNRIAIEKENKGNFSSLFAEAMKKYKKVEAEAKTSSKRKHRHISTRGAA